MTSVEVSNVGNADTAMRKMMAIAVPITLAQLDPHSLSDLSSYVKCLAEAIQKGDRDSIQEISEAIAEVFEIPDTAEGQTVEEMIHEVEQTSDGKDVVDKVRAENESFMARYVEAKAESKITSQRAMAEKCGVAVNTINAIETERTVPQYRTVEKIASGLGVRVEWLLLGQGSKKP